MIGDTMATINGVLYNRLLEQHLLSLMDYPSPIDTAGYAYLARFASAVVPPEKLI